MKKAERILQFTLLLMFIGYSQFYKLGTLTFRFWDESRLATSAYEMSKTGNLLVVTVGHEPDMWSTKPPLMIWAQALSFKVKGFSDFSARLPSALCGALTILLIFGFVLHLTGNGWAALLAGTVLCTSQGYIGYHGTRYGEYDSMLTMFTTAYLILFFCFCESVSAGKKSLFIFLFFISLLMAALTKGVAALLFAPPLLVYAVASKQLVPLFKNKYFYIGIGLFLLVVPGYYLLREQYNPGYIAAVYQNELGGRFMESNEGHSGPANFYIHNLQWERFGNWFWLLVAGLILVWFNSNAKMKRATLYAYLCASLFLLILSVGQTKLWWYDLPAYPLFAIIIGITVLQISNVVSFLLPFINRKIVLLAVCIFASAQPGYEAFQMIRYTYDDLNVDNTYALSYYLRESTGNNKDLNNTIFLSSGYDWPYKLYVNKLHDDGVSIAARPFTGKNIFSPGQRLLLSQQEIRDYVLSNYTVNTRDEFYNVNLYEITGVKTKQQ